MRLHFYTIRLCCFVLLGFSLSGCLVAPKVATPTASSAAQMQEREIQLQLLLQEQTNMNTRLHNVGWNILRAGAPLCEERAYSSGLLIIDQAGLNTKFHAAANALYGLARYPKIVGIAADSNAASTNLLVGDTIVGFDGMKLSGSKHSSRRIVDYVTSKRPGYRLTIMRQGIAHDVHWVAQQICNYPVQLKMDDTVNAFADGRNIVMHSGMMEFARQDTELALIVAHELAHNMHDHIQAQRINSTGGFIMGSLLDAALGLGSSTFGRLGQQIGGQTYSVAFEREADYVGMYIMARSRYPIDEVPLFWRKMGIRNGGRSIDFSSTHPTSVERLTILQATVKEIKAKQDQGLPLIPNGL